MASPMFSNLSSKEEDHVPHPGTSNLTSNNGGGSGSINTADLAHYVSIVNSLLNRCGITHHIKSVSECGSSLFVLLFEGLFNYRLSNIHRQKKQTSVEKLHNIKQLIVTLEWAVGFPLSHVDAEGILNGDPKHLCLLIQIFQELWNVAEQQQLRQLQHIGRPASPTPPSPLPSATAIGQDAVGMGVGPTQQQQQQQQQPLIPTLVPPPPPTAIAAPPPPAAEEEDYGEVLRTKEVSQWCDTVLRESHLVNNQVLYQEVSSPKNNKEEGFIPTGTGDNTTHNLREEVIHSFDKSISKGATSEEKPCNLAITTQAFTAIVTTTSFSTIMTTPSPVTEFLNAHLTPLFALAGNTRTNYVIPTASAALASEIPKESLGFQKPPVEQKKSEDKASVAPTPPVVAITVAPTSSVSTTSCLVTVPTTTSTSSGSFQLMAKETVAYPGRPNIPVSIQVPLTKKPEMITSITTIAPPPMHHDITQEAEYRKLTRTAETQTPPSAPVEVTTPSQVIRPQPEAPVVSHEGIIPVIIPRKSELGEEKQDQIRLQKFDETQQQMSRWLVESARHKDHAVLAKMVKAMLRRDQKQLLEEKSRLRQQQVEAVRQQEEELLRQHTHYEIQHGIIKEEMKKVMHAQQLHKHQQKQIFTQVRRELRQSHLQELESFYWNLRSAEEARGHRSAAKATSQRSNLRVKPFNSNISWSLL